MFLLPFTDTPEWAYEPIAWCYKVGIAAGTSVTTFSPNDPCTRAQMVTFLYRCFVNTCLYVYRISEQFGEIAERIALTEAEAQAILAEERVKITDGFEFSASLHIDGRLLTTMNERVSHRPFWIWP